MHCKINYYLQKKILLHTDNLHYDKHTYALHICIFAYLIIPYAGFRLRALRDMLGSVARAEDIVKVYEARMTEKETTSLSPEEVEDYMSTLKVFFAR